MALISAVSTGDLRLVRRVLSKGCDLNAFNSDGDSALMLAAKGNHIEVITSTGHWSRGGSEAIRRLHGATLGAENGLLKLIKLFVKAAPQLVCATSKDGSNVLAIAAQAGQVEAVKMFFEAGVQVNLKSGGGRTPLMFAAANGQVEVLKLLLENKAAPNKTARDGNTALTLVAEGGHTEAIRVLLSYGARVNRSACPEVAPLAAAAQNGHVEVIKVLLQNHAEIDANDGDWDSALHEAVYSGQLEAARALVEANQALM